MASLLSLPDLPSSCPPFVFTDRRIRRLLDGDELWYLHSRKTGKFHGPFRKEVSRSRTRLTGPWRRGLDESRAFPPPPPGKPLRLSAAQERLLREGLRSVNRGGTPEVWRFERTRDGLRITLLSHRPFRWASWERRFDTEAVRKAAEDLRSALLTWRTRPSALSAAAVLEEPGRRLFRHLLEGTEAGRLLFSEDAGPCLLLPDAFLADLPLELMAERTFLCLLRPVSRAPETFGAAEADGPCGRDGPRPHVLAFADPEPPPALADVERLFRRERLQAALVRVTPRNLRQLLSSSDGLCFVGHGAWRRGGFVWQDRRRLTVLAPDPGTTPAFILSDACNTRFFSAEFLRFFGRLSASGTLSWVGAWSETDYGSTAFVEAFYAAFLRGAAVAEAVLAARQELWSRGHPEALLFGCAGDPMRTFAAFRTFRTG